MTQTSFWQRSCGTFKEWTSLMKPVESRFSTTMSLLFLPDSLTRKQFLSPALARDSLETIHSLQNNLSSQDKDLWRVPSMPPSNRLLTSQCKKLSTIATSSRRFLPSDGRQPVLASWKALRNCSLKPVYCHLPLYLPHYSAEAWVQANSAQSRGRHFYQHSGVGKWPSSRSHPWVWRWCGHICTPPIS